MRGEPVRFISSASYLRIWLDNYPFKNNPVDLEKTAKGAIPLDLDGFRAMIKRAVERHNRRAENLEQQVQNMLETMLIDPEIHKEIACKWWTGIENCN